MIRVHRVLGPELVAFSVRDVFGRSEPTVHAVVKLRKDTQCGECQKPLVPGDRAFRPLSNGDRRMQRYCVPCVYAVINSQNV